MIVLDFSCIYFSFMLIELLNLFIYFYSYLVHSFNANKWQLFLILCIIKLLN